MSRSNVRNVKAQDYKERKTHLYVYLVMVKHAPNVNILNQKGTMMNVRYVMDVVKYIPIKHP